MIPSDIPALEGKISQVMTGQTHIRIFYEGLSQKQFERYLEILYQNGFELEELVFVQEGFPDNSEERLKKANSTRSISAKAHTVCGSNTVRRRLPWTCTPAGSKRPCKPRCDGALEVVIFVHDTPLYSQVSLKYYP